MSLVYRGAEGEADAEFESASEREEVEGLGVGADRMLLFFVYFLLVEWGEGE